VVPDVFDFCAVCTSGSRANFGNHHGNQSCKPVSPLKSCSPTKVVPEPKMGTTVGTTCAPQMPKWFPFRVSRNTDGTTHEVIFFNAQATIREPICQSFPTVGFSRREWSFESHFETRLVISIS
jgi:hypothetical protein